MPDTLQTTNYSCGAMALRSLLGYYGIDLSEEELIKRLGTNENGTPPEAIVRVANELGLKAELRQNMTLEDLDRELKAKRPVIVDAQAWRDETEQGRPWSQVWESGHYLVAIGMDRDKIYLEDPSLEWSRGSIPCQQFEERWHDYEFGPGGSRIEYHHAGILVSGREPAPPAPVLPVD